MPKTLIYSNPNFKLEVDKKQPHLIVAEMFGETIQGEGVSSGVPSIFLRLKNCSLDCSWCDSASVWKFGNPYLISEILDILEENDVVEDLRRGDHWVLTGGSPLLQQDSLFILITGFKNRFGFKPFIEIENECVIEPSLSLTILVDQWNNSPKTANSDMRTRVRYKPDLLRKMSQLKNSWFKFVISKKEDWGEIEEMFLPFIERNQIILMPCGENQEQLNLTRELTVELAIEQGVRYSDRNHIIIWDRKTGV